MKKQLENFIKKSILEPKQDEIDEILDCFEIQELKKGTQFKEAFKSSKNFGFLLEGSMRLKINKENGEEITARLFEKNTFVADVISLKTEQNTPLSIECLSDVSILVAPNEKIFPLLQTNLAFNICLRTFITDRATDMGRNYLLFLTGGAKERYQFLLESNPDLLNKFPLSFIASMIGVTPTQLSRIRNKKTS